MKKNMYKVLAGVLGLSLALGTVSLSVANSIPKNTKNENISYERTELETTDSDSVYVIADSEGNANRIILDDLSEVSSESSMPIDVSVKYILDGKEMKPSEILGKSGHIVIRYDYTNNAKRTVVVDNKSVDMTVPYAAATAVVLDGEKFSNVTVNSGKVLDDGDRYAVVGIAFPGIKENLALNDDKINIPDYTEIEADVENFRLDIAYTLCSGSVFATADLDTDSFSEKMNESIAELTGAMTQLINGSEQLVKGSAELYEGVVTYTQGVAKVADGLSMVDANSAAIQAGAKAVFESLLATSDGSLKAAGINTVPLTMENYEQVLAAVMNNLKLALSKEQAEAGCAKIEGLLGQLRSYQVFYDGIMGYTNGVSQVSAGAAQLKEASASLIEGSSKISEGTMALNAGLKQFDEEGIGKIINTLEGESLKRAKAMLELAKEENSTKNYVYKLESVR
ncbi:MAG: hypothetical protein MJ113_06475 [Lachnospiraceae bacterium]|nr:hypothetical protein [Lachnospiraceae bacterium]